MLFMYSIDRMETKNVANDASNSKLIKQLENKILKYRGKTYLTVTPKMPVHTPGQGKQNKNIKQ